jgi:lipopolysaccharide heptosyltransferase I
MHRLTPLDPGARVLIVRLGAIGDVLRLLPAVRRLRACFPGLHLAWLVEDLAAPLLEDAPDLDDRIVLSRAAARAAARSPRALWDLMRSLRQRLLAGRYDVTIDFQASLKSGVVTRLSGAERRVGPSPRHSREMSFLFLNEWVDLSSAHLNRVDRNLEIVGALGAVSGPADPALKERPEEGREAERLLLEAGFASSSPVVLAPGTSGRQAYKRWPAEHWARLARLLAAAGQRSLVVWGPGEEDLARRVAGESEGARLAPSTGLRLMAALLRRSAVLVGADTGPMHLAWVVGCPVVALFGPTDPRLNAPRGPGDRVLVAADSRMASIRPEQAAEAVLVRLRLSDAPPATTGSPLPARR